MRLLAFLMLIAMPALAAEPRQGDFVLKDFHYHTGEVGELRQHYATLGDPRNPAVMMLHGTNGNGAAVLRFAGPQLVTAGMPLDSDHYFIIVPDSIGAGHSSKPSDGLHQKFPHYNYDDMVAAQHALLTQKLGIKHLRVLVGNSMGGMLAWVWATTYPDFMDAVVPMASQPAPMASRNWVTRRLVIDSIKADPAFQGGEYTAQPPSLKYALSFFDVTTNGGTLAWQARNPTRAAADQALESVLATQSSYDANDVIYQFDAARDYDPSPKLGSITAWVLAINSADDERNPPETGTTAQGIATLAHGKYYLIPASAETRGHSTTANASWWRDQLAAWLPTVPKR